MDDVRTQAERRERDDVDPADALGGAAGLPLPGGQPRGFVPTDRDEPGSEHAPEATDEPPGRPIDDAPKPGDVDD